MPDNYNDMLSLEPVILNETNVEFKELSSFSSVEKALFGEFVSRNNDHFLTQKLIWGNTSESVLNELNNFKDSGIWVVIVDDEVSPPARGGVSP